MLRLGSPAVDEPVAARDALAAAGLMPDEVFSLHLVPPEGPDVPLDMRLQNTSHVCDLSAVAGASQFVAALLPSATVGNEGNLLPWSPQIAVSVSEPESGPDSVVRKRHFL